MSGKSNFKMEKLDDRLSQRSRIYNDYCNKFTNKVKLEHVNNNDEIFKLIKGAEHFSGIRKVNGSGTLDGVYKLKDNRIVQVVINFGWSYRAVIFKNETEWMNYSEPMPWNVYWEGA